MYSAMAYVELADPNASSLPTILGAIGIVTATALLAFALIFITRARRHRQADLITAAAVFWALLTAGSLLYAEQSQMNWSKEYTMRLETGYLDPHDTGDAPTLPWKTWTGLGVAYAGMLAWSLSKKRGEPPASTSA